MQKMFSPNIFRSKYVHAAFIYGKLNKVKEKKKTNLIALSF